MYFNNIHEQRGRGEGEPPLTASPLESYTFMHDGRATVQQDTLVSAVTGVRWSGDELLKFSSGDVTRCGGGAEEEGPSLKKGRSLKDLQFGKSLDSAPPTLENQTNNGR